MTKLLIGFRGLCLFAQTGDEIIVCLPEASRRKNAKDNSILGAHDTQLWVVLGSANIEANGKRTARIINGATIQIPYYDLTGNQQLRILSGAKNAVSLGNHLPSLSGHDALVDPRHPIAGPMAATFRIDRGELGPSGKVPIRWQGTHLGTTVPEMPFMMVLAFETKDSTIRLSRLGLDFIFTPGKFEGEDWVMLLFGAEPRDHGDHQHEDVADHYKWFYELVTMRGVPAGLAHPVVDRARNLVEPNLGIVTLSGSAFCPDTQYP
jgi:hypothetical protein